MGREFYVYTLTDPRSCAVFYVGKGTGRRISHHEVEARKGIRSAKCDHIRDIWKDGKRVKRTVVSRFFDENDALDAEAELIDFYGLENLCNVLPGGKIGIDAYLARAEDRKRMKAIRGRRIYCEAFDGMAPKFARAFKLTNATGGFGMSASGKWMDFGGALKTVFDDVIKILGFDYVADKMRKHGVELQACQTT